MSKGIAASLITTLEAHFYSPQEKNFLEIYKSVPKGDLLEHLACASSGGDFEKSVQHHKGNSSSAMRVYRDEEQLYRSIQSTVQQAILTGRIISGPNTSRLLRLDESTGKPGYACADAFDRNRKVIDILRSGAGVSVIEEHDLQSFNQASVMAAFNAGFKAAILVSTATLTATAEPAVIATTEPPIPSDALPTQAQVPTGPQPDVTAAPANFALPIEDARALREKFHSVVCPPEQPTTQLSPDDAPTNQAPGNTLGS